ncbi:MAG TPA: phosphoenolpyruvate carboxykinase domain-containing protein [Polyangiaceae bacterium]|nr:phosphoenolpyruvate carboxykinase domain-containing protein [Polyangiaceae bacterium]
MSKTPNLALRSWVRTVAEHTQPDDVHWWAGTDEERKAVTPGFAASLANEQRALDPAPVVVATHRRVDAGPTNLWMSRDDAQARLWPLFSGVMRRRTMYVVPYMLGAPRSPFCKVGVELTDSPRVAASIDALARSGRAPLDELAGSLNFARSIHSVAHLKQQEQLIVHFPDIVETWSIGSDSLPNAVLCCGTEGLRLASARAREEGWLAEHMTLFSVTDPSGAASHLAVAGADAGGIDELEAIPPLTLGWQIKRLGGEVCWLRASEDGTLSAICPDLRSWEPTRGVPLSAIVFCGRQARSTPLVYEARSWRHGVYVGATLMREMDGAGSLGHNPMSMLGTCSYNMGNYFSHWLAIGRKLHYPPKIFHVNWFRTEGGTQRIWPGGQDNMRILKWIIERCAGDAPARSSALGLTPDPAALDRDGLDLAEDRLAQALTGNPAALLRQAEGARRFLSKFGDCLPAALLTEHRSLVRRLQESLH